jgi:hypothetical protein
MPEASVHEDTCAILLQHQVWMPRQPWRIKPITEPPAPQPLAHNHLWLRILRMDRCHILMPLFCRKFIHICLTHKVAMFSGANEKRCSQRRLYQQEARRRSQVRLSQASALLRALSASGWRIDRIILIISYYRSPPALAFAE